jgi:NAD(P)-dependent dehydrogenase (short-subunit alcohol dehydrogenase family)
VPGVGLYCITKHAATALANVLRFELKQWGITVHDVQPGFFRQVVCLFVHYFLCTGSFVPLGSSTTDRLHNFLTVSLSLSL